MLKLMVIDDHAGDRVAVERIVKSLSNVKWIGAYVKPQEALNEAAKSKPHVVIAAVELADMNGIAFTSKLQDILPSVCVIVSAQSGHYAREAYEAGARGYLIKPIGKESLMKMLDHARTKYWNWR